MPRITLVTDFGTADGYVAAMKGVVASLAPEALLDDAGHETPQGDVVRAAWPLGRYWPRFPEGTVHLVVVDPGVGTERRPLAAGRALGALGRRLSDPVLLREPEPLRRSGKIEGEVVGPAPLREPDRQRPRCVGADRDDGAGVGTLPARAEHLRGGGAGGLLALVNSAGRLEVAVRAGSAARELGAEAGLPARVVGEVAGG